MYSFRPMGLYLYFRISAENHNVMDMHARQQMSTKVHLSGYNNNNRCSIIIIECLEDLFKE